MERDDLHVNDSYAPMANHSEEEGKKIRKKVWFVTALLSIITAVEIGVGIAVGKMYEGIERADGLWTTIKWSLIILTLVKAFYIVMEFMHLGHENKSLRRYIIIPYLIFIAYMIFLFLTEGFNVDRNAY